MKVKAVSEIDLDPNEMKEYMYEAAREMDEQFYEMLTQAPTYGDKFDEWESEINEYIAMTFDDSNEYIFADFILSTPWWNGQAIVPICKTWLKFCGDNKLKPLLQECVDKNVMLFWE